MIINESHDGAGVGGVLLADDPVAAAAAAAGVAGVRLGHVLREVLRRGWGRGGGRGRLGGLAAGAAVAPAVAVVAAAVGRPRRVRVRVRPRVGDLHHLGRRRGGLLLLGRCRGGLLLLGRGWLLLGRLLLRWRGLLLGWLLLGRLHLRRRRRGGLLLLLRRRRGLLLLLRLLLGLGRRRGRGLDDLDLLDDLARLAAQLVGELVRVEGPRDLHLVVLLVEVDVIDAELALLCKPRRPSVVPGNLSVAINANRLETYLYKRKGKSEQQRGVASKREQTLDPVEHPLDLGAAAAAFQVHRDDDGRHRLRCTNSSAGQWSRRNPFL
jgi:hypothetical protein